MLFVFIQLIVSSPKKYESLAALLLVCLNLARNVLIVETTRASHAYRYSCAELTFLRLEQRDEGLEIALLVIDNTIHTLYGLLVAELSLFTSKDKILSATVLSVSFFSTIKSATLIHI